MDLDNDDVESLKQLADNFISSDSTENNVENSELPAKLAEKKSSSLDDRMQSDGSYNHNSHYSYNYYPKSERKNRKKGRKKHRKHIKNKYNLKQKDTAVVKQDKGEEVHNVISGTGSKNGKVRFRTCSELTCQARGKCVPDKLRGGVRCQCKLGTEGDFCERGKANLMVIVRVI